MSSPNELSAQDTAWSGPFCVERRVAHDANDQARAIAGWTQEYDQLTPGAFEGALTELCLDHIHLFAESTSHALRQTCEVRPDAYWFGIPADDIDCGRIGARAIAADAFAFKPGSVEFELVTPARYRIFGIVVKGSVLRRHAAEVEHMSASDLLFADDSVSVGGTQKARLCAALDTILSDAPHASIPLPPVARENLQSQILASLFDLCASGRAHSGALHSKPHRKWIVEAARAYVLEHRDRPVAVPELCAQLRASRRLLQYCFQEFYGMTPVAYLRAIRLNGVRRALRAASWENAVSVQDVAAAWGFWHLSQFSADYRKLFGVRPSDTLREAIGLRAA
ncbi:AraC family transcriptional regulator [Caballeronia arationis]|jgi:AraC family ethanolamine operon transcriptional activator|uniref:Transcriptional regulator, AraC family n=1 Tax=Caballeronia arationis TaxID=1777142 RepID=A0A7Z7N1H2_9BURK|nr:helix-turn-helix domain-containing protein [Caballeronia arationis]SAK47844.1 AraC family transcriptional regulator [Caballeronia arationis]SOE59698.1 transcriptional regulator, AraC family [Caballeronia arationis]